LTDLAGGIITFAAPSSGPSVVLSLSSTSPNIGTATLDSSNDASAPATANAISSSNFGGAGNLYNYFDRAPADYTVTASALSNLTTPVTFNLTNRNIVLNVTATANIDGSVNLRWVNASQATTYTILRGTSLTDMSQINTVSAPATDYTSPVNLASVYTDHVSSGLEPNTLYYYEVQAEDSTTGLSFSYAPVSVTTAAGDTYSATLFESATQIPSSTESGQQITVTTAKPLLAGVHYEIVASGFVDSTGTSDAEYAYAPNSGFDPSSIGPTPNATIAAGLPGWVGHDYVNFGIGVNDESSEAVPDENHYPYWGSYNPTNPDQYAIDVVGTGAPFTFTYLDDFYEQDKAGHPALSVSIYQYVPPAQAVDVTATAMPAPSSGIEVAWSYVPPTSGSLTMSLWRSIAGGTFTQIDSQTVTGLTNGNPVITYPDNSVSTANTTVSYEVQASYEGEQASTSNIATAVTAANGPYATTPIDTISVPVDGSTVTSHVVLLAGVHYELEAFGTTTMSGGILADADYIYPDGVAE
jgi:hypothetical protein